MLIARKNAELTRRRPSCSASHGAAGGSCDSSYYEARRVSFFTYSFLPDTLSRG